MALQEGLTMTDSDDLFPAGESGTPEGGDPESSITVGDDTDSSVDTENETDSDAGDETSEETETQDVDDAKTAKRVNDTEAALKARQAELTRVNQELAAAKAVQAEIAALREAAGQKDDTIQDYLAGDSWHERYNERATEDPAAAATELLMRERQQLTALLEARDDALMARARAIVGEATNPERAAMSDTLAKLGGEIPNFKALPSDTQLAMAKAFRKAGGNGAAAAKPQTLKPSAGSQGGTGRRVVDARDPKAEREKASEQAAKSIFGGPISDDEALYPMGRSKP